MGTKKWLRWGLGGLLIVSAMLKLTAISYVTNILFALLPLGWLNSFAAGHLAAVVIGASLLELAMGIGLWTHYYPMVLPVLAGYLLLMILLNGYQWQAGIGDCGCLGGWLHLPPALTFIKTTILLAAAGYLLLQQTTGRPRWRLSHQS